MRDSSLKVDHGIEGTVIDIQRLKRTEGDDLSPGVDEVVKVLIATNANSAKAIKWRDGTATRALSRAYFRKRICHTWKTEPRLISALHR